MAPDLPVDQIRRASRTFAGLVIAAVFGCALVSVLGMLVVYGILLFQGELGSINPGIFAGAMLMGAMQGVNALPLTLPLGALLHLALKRAGRTGLLPYVGAGLVTAAVAALVLGFFGGFVFNSAFVVMGVASGALGGSLFWIARRPDKDGTTPSTAIAS